MSKIEIVSRHKGPVGFTLKNDEPVKVVFEDKGDVGYAQVEPEHAEHLLAVGEATRLRTGKPDFWKPGEETKLAQESDKSEAAGEPGALTEESYPNFSKYKPFEAAAKACSDVPLLMKILSLEVQRDKPRDGFVKVLNGRLDELKAGASPAAAGSESKPPQA